MPSGDDLSLGRERTGLAVLPGLGQFGDSLVRRRSAGLVCGVVVVVDRRLVVVVVVGGSVIVVGRSIVVVVVGASDDDC